MHTKGLTNNQLKLIAIAAMTLDHIGAYLFPTVLWLRAVGRLAYPLFAYMIAEGCRYTRSPWRYFLTMAGCGTVFQVVYTLATGSLYIGILITFSLSIGLIFLAQNARMQKTCFAWGLAFAGFCTAVFVCEGMPRLLPGTDYFVDYGLIGVLIPVAIYLGTDKASRLILATAGLACMCCTSVWLQWLSLLAIPLLMLYNGQRGKWKLKWLFYIYYPAHLLAIYAISFLMT